MNSEELLSAYLDGEVTAAERAQVEQLLATDPEMRAALEELRALSASLQSLPKLTVGEDLSQRVLRRAERAMLERQTVEPAPAVKTVPVAPQRTLLDQGSYGAGWTRRLAWPLAAIAATLLIMLVNKEPQPDVALAPVGDAEMQAPEAAKQGEFKGANLEDADVAIDAETASRPGSNFAAEAEEAGTPIESASGQVTSNENARDENTTNKDAADLADRKAFETPRMHAMRASDKRTDATSERQANASSAADERREQEPGQRQLKATSPAPAAPADTAPSAQSIARANGDAGGNVAEGGSGAGGAAVPGAAFSARGAAMDDLELRKQLAAVPSDVDMVVEVVASATAQQQESLNALLSRQNIQFDGIATEQQRNGTVATNGFAEAQGDQDRSTDKAESTEPLAAAEQTQPGKAAGPGEKFAGQKPATAKEKAELGLAQKDPNSRVQDLRNRSLEVKKFGKAQGADRDAAGKLVVNEVDVILVTATPSQVLALLKDLQSQPEQYRTQVVDAKSPHGLLADLKPDQAPAAPTAGDEPSTKVAAADAPAVPGEPVVTQPQAPAADANESLAAATTGYAVQMRVAAADVSSLLAQAEFAQAKRDPRDVLGGRGGIDNQAAKRTKDELAKAAGLPMVEAESEKSSAIAGEAPEESAAPEAKADQQSQVPMPARSQVAAKAGSANAPAMEKKQKATEEQLAEKKKLAERSAAAEGDGTVGWDHDGLKRRGVASLQQQLQAAKGEDQIRVLLVMRGAGPATGIESPSKPATAAPAAEPTPAAQPSPAKE